MELLTNLFNQRKPSPTIRSRRALIIYELVEEINKEREGSKFKPVKPSFVAFKTSHLSVDDLQYLYNSCLRYQKERGSFGKCFYGSLKIK